MMPRSNDASRAHRLLAGGLLLWLAASMPVDGGTELVLVDGRVLAGSDVRREGDDYVLTLESGDEITLPVQLVETVRLTGTRTEKAKAPNPQEEYLEMNPGIRVGEPVTLGGGIPSGPTGMTSAEPQQLAGEPVRAQTPSEQLEVFGEPAEFQRPIVDNSWRPSTDWNMDPDTQNNFAPSRWSESIVDNSWQPESAFDARADVMKDSRSTWQRAPIDSAWTPTDGFSN